MADEPLRGFGQRIIDRARLPVGVLLALPFFVVAIEYFFFLLKEGTAIDAAIKQVKEDGALFVWLVGIPPVILAFFRELQVHELVDKFLGVRAAVDEEIRRLLQELASDAGYAHSDRIAAAPRKAREWFYSIVNEQQVLRAYAFEVWEAYYVGLYLSLASFISFAVLAVLGWFFISDSIVWSCAGLCALIFFAEWAVRHWSTIPKIKKIPSQQIAEISASPKILLEAMRRFD